MGKAKERDRLNKIIRGQLKELKAFRRDLSQDLMTLFYDNIDNHVKNSFADSHFKPFLEKLEILQHAYNSILLTKTTSVTLSKADKQRAYKKCQEILNMHFETTEMQTLQQYITLMCSNEIIKENPQQKQSLEKKFQELMPSIKPFDFTEARGLFLQYLRDEHLVKIGAELKGIMSFALLELIAIYYAPSLYAHHTIDLNATSMQHEKELDLLFKILETHIDYFSLNFLQTADQEKRKTVVPELKNSFAQIKKIITEMLKVSSQADQFLSDEHEEYKNFKKTCRHRVLSTRPQGKYDVSSAIIKDSFHHEKDFNTHIFSETIQAKAKALYDAFVNPIKAYSHYTLLFGDNKKIQKCFNEIQTIPNKIINIKNISEETSEELSPKQKKENMDKLHELYKTLLHLERVCVTQLKMSIIKKKSLCGSQANTEAQNIFMNGLTSLTIQTSLAVSGEMRQYRKDDTTDIYNQSYASAELASKKTYRQLMNFLHEHFTLQEIQALESSYCAPAEHSANSSSSGSETGILDTDSSSSSETEAMHDTPIEDLPAAEVEAESPRELRRATLSPAQLARRQNGMWRNSVTPSSSKRPRSQSERQTGDAVGSPMAMIK